MTVDEVFGQAWTRMHDDPAIPVVPSTPRTVYPKSLEELIEICAKRNPAERIRAAGSHWSLSEAAISDGTFVETHDPNNNHQALGRTLYDVVPGCLNKDFIAALASREVAPFDENTVTEDEGLYPIHIETGKRVYQLYSELDAGDDDERSLAVLLKKMNNLSYLGAWGFQTLGGAGGQTVFGALTTGTHGGDFRMPPIADSVMALHLVANGGTHYWIEPESPTQLGARLTDDEPLRALYGDPRYGGPENFQVIRDDTIFNSVLVSAGRFGIVYSIVIAAVRQYCLHQECRLTTWQSVKGQIGDPTSALSTQTQAPSARNRFLQIGVSVTPHHNFSRNLAGVTKRWNVPFVPAPSPPGTIEPAGRQERRGKKGDFDQVIQAPRFEFAGNSSPYSPDPSHPGVALPPDFLTRACANGDFLAGVIDSVLTELDNFVNSNGASAGPIIRSAAALGASGLRSLLSAISVIRDSVRTLLPWLTLPDKRFGQVMNDVRDLLLNRTNPGEREAGLFVWHMFVYQAFSSQQKDSDFEAISYAVMDIANYLDQSCSVNADSIEVFFDATDPMLIAYVDALLAYEIGQEVIAGKAFVGYISLRFTGPTRALIGEQRFPLTCAVEVSGLRDVSGVTELIDYAIMLALDSNFKGILHWGQRNESVRAHVQERFGDNLDMWRNALSRMTQNGKLDGFSSAFTRRTGLEIVIPRHGSLSASSSTQTQLIDINWDYDQNPPATEISLTVTSPSGTQSSFVTLPLIGQQQVPAAESGIYSVSLIAAIDLGGERHARTRQVQVMVV